MELTLLCYIVIVIIHIVQPNPCSTDVNHPFPPPISRTPYDLDDSFYMLRVLRRPFPRVRFNRTSVSVIPFAGDKTCRNRKKSSKTLTGKRSKIVTEYNMNELPDQFTKSTCKSYLVLNHDPYRTPATVVEVRCACRHCQTTSGQSSNDCKPIYNYRRMWRRECDAKTGTYVDVEVLEPLIVGCTCVKNTSKQLKRSKHSKI